MAYIHLKEKHSSTTNRNFSRWFIQHLFTNPIVILVVIIGTGAVIFTRLLIPIILGESIDVVILNTSGNLTTNEQIHHLWRYVLVIILLGILQFIISIITSLANEWLSWSAQKQIRLEFFDSMQNKPLKFHDSVRTGELMALATNDLGQIGGMISPGLSMIADVFISILLSTLLVIGVLQAPQLLLICIPFFIIYLWAIFRHNKKLAPVSNTFMRKWGAIATAVQDNISGVEVVRAFAEESYEREKFMNYVFDFKKAWYKRQVILAQYFPTLVLFAAIGFSVFIGVFFIIDEQITIGTLIAFYGLLITLIGPTYTISFAIDIFNAGLASARRIHSMEVKEAEEDSGEDEHSFAKIQGKITFENVSFKYPTSKKYILENISFTVAPGQTIAIVGPTGSGKSSITKLLLRLYDYEGIIKIDDINIKKFSLKTLRKNIGRIEQDIYLFPRSVRENISFGARNTSQSEIEKAAKLAQAHEFIVNDLSDGYDTNVGEAGSQLSGGQKQRIALARTFVTNPRILILDDSTSSVDSKTEEEIVKAINTVSKGRTTFIITHRISVIKRADCIFVVKGAKIVDKGHHSRLIYSSPDYRRIFGKNVELNVLKEKKSENLAGCE